ncbi:MAG: V-type ATP synthase subunit E [Promethearchaeota archaeon]|jgi:vacuolar-type H+-ATPase subunit E/Vma4
MEKAQEEIKDLTQKTLFQKAEIKKRFLERGAERSLRLRQQFIESYEQFLNQSLSSTLLNGKEKFLKLKNNLIIELRKSLFNLIEINIEKNYPAYIDFLLNSIREVTKTIDKPQEIELIFNERDYSYFLKEHDKIENLFQNPVEINKDRRDYTGGFKISLIGGVISYDYTIDSIIDKISPFIQMEISKIVIDVKIKEIENDFEKFVKKQKQQITEHLRKYDQLQT